MKNEDGQMTSEGKILEIAPVLYLPDGRLLSLPPTTYQCPGWLLGYFDEHIQGHPYIMYFNERIALPGTNTAHGVMLSFFARIYENQPGMVSDTPTISEEWVKAFAELVETNLSNRVSRIEEDMRIR